MASDENKPLTEERPDYNAVFGVSGQQKTVSTATIFGKINHISDCRRFLVEWIFLGLSLLAFLGSLGISIERLVHFSLNYTNESNENESGLRGCHTWTCSSDYTFTVVLIINIMFCLFYAIDGVLRERLFEVLAVVLATVVVLIYLIGNFIYRSDERSDPLRISRLVLSLVFGPILIGIALLVCYRMGKLQFVLVGANRTLMRAYQIRGFLSTVLLFNMEVMSNATVLALTRSRTFIDTAEVVIIILLVVFVFFINIFGWTAIWYESKWLTITFIVLFSPTVIYPVYKVVNVSMNFGLYIGLPGPGFYAIAICLLASSLIWIAMSAITLVFTVFVYQDFGKGLFVKAPPPFLELYKKLQAKIFKPT